MKAKVGNTGDEVEIGQYREVNKGSLKAFFTLVEYSPAPNLKGRKTFDCRYFVQDDKAWISFPQKEIKYTNGRKTEFIPLVSYMDKEYLEQLKNAVLSLLKTAKPQEYNGQAKNNPNSFKKAPVQNNAPADWSDDAPF